MPAEVIGRDEELAAIGAFLAEVEQGPAALVLSGEAGIGKTILWEAGLEKGRERFGHVLSHRSVEAEALVAFGGLSDLLSPVLDEVLPSLAPPRRRALEVALWLAEPGEQPPDPGAIGLAFLDVLRLLAQHGPVLVALDDLQWLDSSSALVVPLALRRLRDERIGLLADLRKTSQTQVPFELERAFPEDRLSAVSVGPLSLGALHHLLRDRLGLKLTRPELGRVHERSGGNPFFALELGRELVRTGTRRTAGQALPVPESLHELLGGRLARLPGETLDVLLHMAALARPTVELITAAHGDEKHVLRALDEGVRDGVVQLDGARPRFVHPLLASICYDQAPSWKRRAVHLALAEAVSDIEERARHLALAAAGPDASVASELDAAAEVAAARGAKAAAAELCDLAAELTGADPLLARRRRLRSANLHRLAGDTEHAVGLLEQLVAETCPGVERADVLFELAMTQKGTRSQIELCDEALAEAEGDDARCARILALRTGANLLQADVDAALVDARAALEKAERAGDPSLLAVAIAWAGQAETYASKITPGLLERGVEIEQSLGLELEWNHSPHYVLARRLMRLGEIERARAAFRELAARAEARGDEVTGVMVLWPLSMLEWLAGRWQRALGHAVAAYELTQQTRHPHAVIWVGRVKALIETDLGLLDQARASAEESRQSRPGGSSYEFSTIVTGGVLGRLELARGNLEAAGGYLRDLPAELLSGGLNDPTLPVWPDAIETLIALSELEQAATYLEAYELNARQLGSPWAVAAAARCRGLLSAAEGELEAAFEAFGAALSEPDAYPYPLERARTLLCLGTVRRQAGQKKAAREALEQALAIFEELRAPLWAEKARGELKRISGRRAAAEELTETELRVATLAGQGRSNKEIAAELFIGVSTVEMHLSRVYRKLGVRRAGLGARLAIPPTDAAKTMDEAAQA
jgi:ATP/maltotriose-dependent transcriptional regulator MalT